jgi:hypothetical protein
MTDLQVFEYKNERVLNTRQLAESYGTKNKVISNNFSRNKDRYVEGKHYYCLEGDGLRAIPQIEELPPNVNKLYFWTERGALLHAKSLNTDKAWEVYEQLVETYFRVKQQSLSPQAEELISKFDERLARLEAKGAAKVKKKAAEGKPTVKRYGNNDVVTLEDMSKLTCMSAHALRHYFKKYPKLHVKGQDWFMLDRVELARFRNANKGVPSCKRLMIVTKSCFCLLLKYTLGMEVSAAQKILAVLWKEYRPDFD